MRTLSGILLALICYWLVACSTENAPVDDAVAMPNAPSPDSTLLTAGGQSIYRAYCAGCHGANLEGNSAPALLKSEWKYGRSRGLMQRNIQHGIPGTEMGAFKTILTGDQIRKVVDFIREQQNVSPDREVMLPEELETEDYRIMVEQVVAKGLEVPWAIEFIDDQKALISERKGQLRWLVNGKLDPQPITGTPATHTGSSTGGYMDIALDPDFATTGWIYLAYSYTTGDLKDEAAPATTKVVRGKIEGHLWKSQQMLFEAPDSLWVKEGNRWGCRFLFDQQKRLLFTVGDMGQAMDSQNLGKVSGKVFRINRDGTIPVDNPFVGKKGALEAIFSIGNRNVQGLSIHPETGEIWASEHGPMGGDELNILRAGANYGWPLITYGLTYGGDIVSEKTQQEGMEQPIYQWTPSIAVCPIEFMDSPLFPIWKNNLLVGALAFEELNRYVIKDKKIVYQEPLLKEQGRVRDIKTAPDGTIYVVLNRPDGIIRLLPKPNG